MKKIINAKMTGLKIKSVKGRGIPLRGNDMDTDRIIPARYLKEITFDNMGKYAFYDERFDSGGKKKIHPFNDEKYLEASILIVNRNFGCGSSREHAPQSLMRFGIKAIIGESFAGIFASNCTTIGIPAVAAQKEDIGNLMQFVENNPGCEVKIDLESSSVSYGDFSFSISQPKSSRIVLMQGIWDPLSELQEAEKEAKKIAERLPYLNKFRAQ